MHRRTFLAASAATLATGVLASQPRPSQPEPVKAAPSKRTLRKAVMIGMVGEGANLTDKFKLLRDTGFEGVELDSPSDIHADEVLKAMDASGIKVHGLVDSVHWKHTLNNPEAEVRAKA